MDLNLLRVFVAILDTGSVTAAAGQLQLTQPTVSHALKRLRQQLSDPLFIRRGAGIVPTARALELGPLVRSAIAELDEAFEAPSRFNPKSTQREFRIRLSDIGELTFLPHIQRAMQEQAPLATVSVDSTPVEQVVDALARGEIDAAVASVDIPVTGRAYILRSDRYVAILHPQDAPTRNRLTAQDIEERRHVAVSSSVGHAQIEAALDAMGVQRRIALQVRQFMALPPLIAEPGMMAVMPANMATVLAAAWGFAIRELPSGMPSFDVMLYWDSASIGTVGPRAWFVNLIRDALAARN